MPGRANSPGYATVCLHDPRIVNAHNAMGFVAQGINLDFYQERDIKIAV